MGIIINGVLGDTLNWGLVLIGVMLAIGIELCGKSSLAFAVGVYIPMQYTTPIFLGGFISWLAGRFGRSESNRQQDEASAIVEAETSSGTLLASGYIAGGTLAGVAIAFLEFWPWLKDKLNYHQQIAGTFVDSRWFPATLFAVLIIVLAIVGMRRADNAQTRT
jgi:uncharacterized oligopeptide transporter (OPT) family protein